LRAKVKRRRGEWRQEHGEVGESEINNRDQHVCPVRPAEARLHPMMSSLTEAEEQRVDAHGVDAEEAVSDEVSPAHHRLRNTATGRSHREDTE